LETEYILRYWLRVVIFLSPGSKTAKDDKEQVMFR
jgi:hypothetical protein